MEEDRDIVLKITTFLFADYDEYERCFVEDKFVCAMRMQKMQSSLLISAIGLFLVSQTGPASKKSQNQKILKFDLCTLAMTCH